MTKAKGPMLHVRFSSELGGTYAEVTSAADFKKKLKFFASRHKLDPRQVYVGVRDASGSDFAGAIAVGLFDLDRVAGPVDTQEAIVDYFAYVEKNERLSDSTKALLMAEALDGAILPTPEETYHKKVFHESQT